MNEPAISDAEWRVMEVLWDEHPLTANEVVAALESRESPRWHPRTVKTLLGRLVRKGALGFERAGKSYLYAPRRTRDQCVRAETRSFLAKVFGGAPAPALIHFAEEAKLEADEIARLEKILDEKRRKQRGKS